MIIKIAFIITVVIAVFLVAAVIYSIRQTSHDIDDFENNLYEENNNGTDDDTSDQGR